MDETMPERPVRLTALEHESLLQRVQTMTPDEIDALPVGVLSLGLDGTILEYNRTEAEMAHRDADRQIGKNFFRDVAPCTASPEFEGRFRELAKPGASGKVEFDYEFPFPWALEKVLITFLRASGAENVFVIVTWLFDIRRPAQTA